MKSLSLECSLIILISRPLFGTCWCHRLRAGSRNWNFFNKHVSRLNLLCLGDHVWLRWCHTFHLQGTSKEVIKSQPQQSDSGSHPQEEANVKDHGAAVSQGVLISGGENAALEGKDQHRACLEERSRKTPTWWQWCLHAETNSDLTSGGARDVRIRSEAFLSPKSSDCSSHREGC